MRENAICITRFLRKTIIAFVRKHYIPEGGPNISTAKSDSNLRATPSMYIYILIRAEIREQNFKEQNFKEQTD